MTRRNTLTSPRGRRSSPPARLAVQNLECRLAPANFTVLNADDAGAGSLRQAILDSNFATSPGPDTIDFDTTFFSTPRTINLVGASGQLTIDDDLVITGPGVANLTVSGSNATRIFNVESSTAVINVAISDMTVTGGNGTNGTGTTLDGGGIRTTNEILTLEDMVVTGNSAPAGFDGGGVSATSTAFITIRNSTISGNSAGKHGGGVYFFSGGALLMENSTVSGNTSGGSLAGGGGIYFFGTVTADGFTIRNSTIAGNTANTGSGGGLVLRLFSGTALIQNSTFTNNSATTTSTVAGAGGGGIAISSGSASSILQIESTIVSGNSASAANGRSDIATIDAATFDAFNSAIGDPDGFTLSAGSTGNLSGAALNLQPLGNYGGPTQTVALGVGSLAVGAGSNPTALAFDQRGTGFPREVGGTVDIGAFEGVVDFPIGTSSALPNIQTSGGTSYPFVVTYTSSSPINTSTLDNNDIRITGPGGFNVLATLGTFDATNPNAVIVNYSFTPPGGSWNDADNGAYSVVLQAGQVSNNAGQSNIGATLGTFQVGIPATFTVTNLDDAGTGSLRQAIVNSNATPGVIDTIVFQAGLTGTITLATGQLTISDGVTITGPGAAAVTVDGGGTSRVFNVDGGGVITVSISGLTVSGGNGSTGGATPTFADGGGIRTVDENLTLENMIITGNTATATSPTVFNDGGGVSAASTANIVIRNSTISGNTSSKNGGGIYFFSGGSLLMENSTVSGNSAAGTVGGGGVYFFGTVAAAGFTISNSTIANNTAPAGSGGGVVLRTLTGTALVQNSTITGNTSGIVSTTVGLGGGGIALSTGGAASILTLRSTIVSGNTSDPGTGSDDLSALALGTVNAYNSAIGDPDGHTLSGASTGNLASGAVLNLGTLSNNGGPTQTISLGAGSLAINAGANATPALAFDQRGAGFARDVGGVDIGAFEVQGAGAPPTVLLALVNNSTVNQRSRVSSVSVTFSTAVTFAGAVANAFTLTRTGGGAIGGFTATASLNGLGQTVVVLDGFTGAETTFGSLNDGNYVLTALANQISAGGTNMAANFVFGAVQSDRFYRFYGDITGDRRVDIADFGFFSAGYLQGPGGNVPALDYNQDGRLDITDFGQFSVRFFTSLP